MKIVATKHSKDGLATVTFQEVFKGSIEDAKVRADALLNKAGAVLNTRAKQIKAKEKAKAARR